MNAPLIDTHCHLDADAFAQDLDEVVKRASSDSIDRLLTIGITLATSKAAVDLAERFENVWAVVGIQPNYAHEATASGMHLGAARRRARARARAPP